MDQITSVVSENLKRLRETKKLSLDKLAAYSGVSKSMLGQIERGEVTPTITTVWKIADGLKVSFTELFEQTEQPGQVLLHSSIEPITEDGGRTRNYPLYGFDATRRFEMYMLELDPGSRLEAQAHPEGTEEFITVFSGALQVRVGEQVLKAPADASIHFVADQTHSYENTSRAVSRLSMVIYYPR